MESHKWRLAEGCWQLPRAGRDKKWIFLAENPPERVWPTITLIPDFWPPKL